MNLTIEKIAEIINGELEGDKNKIITSIKPIDIADENSISYIENLEKANKLIDIKAGCIIVPLGERNKLNLKTNLIFVKNPKLAFAKLLEKEVVNFRKKYLPFISSKAIISPQSKIPKSCYIGHFCVIEDGVELGENVVIESGCYIGRNSKIGNNTLIYPGVVIRENVFIGNDCIIHSNTTIGSDGYGYVRDNDEHIKIQQIGIVRIGNKVEIGANCSIDRATLGETAIGDGSKIDNLVHIAHNVKIGKNCLILAQAGISGSCEIGNNVIIGGQVGVADHIIIEDNSIIMSKSGVIGKVKKGSILFGFLARPRSEYMKIEAILTKLPEIYSFYKKVKKILNLEDEKKDN